MLKWLVLSQSSAEVVPQGVAVHFGCLYCVHPWEEIGPLQGSGLHLENHCPKGSDCFSDFFPPGL